MVNQSGQIDVVYSRDSALLNSLVPAFLFLTRSLLPSITYPDSLICLQFHRRGHFAVASALGGCSISSAATAYARVVERGISCANSRCFFPEKVPMDKYRHMSSRVCTASSLYRGKHVMNFSSGLIWRSLCPESDGVSKNELLESQTLAEGCEER
ncbi:hypothetical protein BDN70DRAFT_516761 [Pholiota conissans]|uniref:Uncharacterized protein n=1 Tax=Pholiota conissans TaxID=109636 RepID=A0A9P6CTU9_9AGAR|nr:hypothetical protein BDN70DRAFT_516761 [Pholiota conissans]